MKKFMSANIPYVSPVSVEIGLSYDGVILVESNVDLGFEFEDWGEMLDGEHYEIGG